MKHCFPLLSLLFGVSLPVLAAEPRSAPSQLEFRGVWLATVGNIDWPSRKGLSTEEQKKELLAVLDKAVELKLNAVIFQVRPMCDALYASELEPWSEFLTGKLGQAPEPLYDPLETAVREAHARGLELHAWFNPYRAHAPSAKSPIPDNHIVKRRPELAKRYGKHYWLNPTHPEVMDHSLKVILDVVRRYDVDGVHLDDYFYPYKEKDDAGKLIPFPDDDTWARYQRTGGKLGRDDWRRDAVNHFIRRLYQEVKALKPRVQVGISPFGIWRPGNPPGIEGYDAFAELYADARLWLREGWVDYLSPQLYWPIAHEKQSYPKLLDWWLSENPKGRHIWPGLFTSRAAGEAKGWSRGEITKQIELTRQRKAGGSIHFSMRSLQRNRGGIADEIKKVYAEPARVPPSPWLTATKRRVPATPRAGEGPGVRGHKIKAAVERALPLLQESAATYTEHRDCFSCHHQSLPVLALSAARKRGFAIDEEIFKQQLTFTFDNMAKARDNYRKGRGLGGQVATAGYALWALEAGGRTGDDTTAAMAEYLLLRNEKLPYWEVLANRPPSEATNFTTTYLALRGLRTFGTPEQQERIRTRADAARKWLLQTEPQDNEERVFRLWGLKLAGATDEDGKTAARELLLSQRPDGGWRQTDKLTSDAYATGSALVVLHEVGGLRVDDPAYRKGVDFLLADQLDDGSWRVESRSRPFQTYFESGFPHGKNQFISIAASGWATWALALVCSP